MIRRMPPLATLAPRCCVAAMLAVALFASAVPAAADGDRIGSQAELVRALQPLADDPRVAGVTTALCVADPASGDILVAARADRPLVPASNQKLLVTAAALETLGPDWRFRTRVGLRGDDLVVIGGGDPNLSGRFYDGDTTAAFHRWAEALRERGVSSVAGRLVFDDFAFDDRRVHPGWPADQRLNWYEAPVGALVLNDSCIDVRVRGAAAPGQAAAVLLDPPTDYFSVEGTIDTRREGKALVVVHRPAGTERLIVRGHVPAGRTAGPFPRTVDDPGRYAATVIRETFESTGLPIAGGVVRERVWTGDWRLPEDFRPQLVHTSTLAQSVRVTNRRSQGLYAECIGKALAAFGPSDDPTRPVRQGSWEGADEAVRASLRRMNVSVDGLEFDDCSGLSRGNRVTARTLAELLVAMHRGPHREVWMDSLAVSGQADGSLRSRLRTEPLKGRVFAKTGYLNDTRTLSGYVRTLSGRTLVFVALANELPFRSRVHSNVKAWQDDVCRTLVRY